MSAPFPRSPELMNASDTALLLVDVQQRLVPVVADSQHLAWNVRRLLDGAGVLGVPAVATEQYPEKLGSTLPDLVERLGDSSGEGAGQRPSKLMFSCRECAGLVEPWLDAGRHRVLIAGIETHVCVQQTALDLMSAGMCVYLAVDAVSSRFTVDHQTALRRLESSGVTLTTTEAALFEWCERAGSTEFKAISQLAKEAPPG